MIIERQKQRNTSYGKHDSNIQRDKKTRRQWGVEVRLHGGSQLVDVVQHYLREECV